MRLLLPVLVLLIATAPRIVSAADDDVYDIGDFPPVESLSLKVIRTMLDDRAVSCKGCLEKSGYVEKLKESLHLPLKKPDRSSKPKGGGGGGGSVGGMSNEDQRKLMEMMGKQGGWL